MPAIEQIPANEPEHIASIIEHSAKSLARSYPPGEKALRGQHARDHGCVKATFRVLSDIPAAFRVGVFATPGREYQAYVRFSNAEAKAKKPDSTVHPTAGVMHGSRGMAIKLMGVSGSALLPVRGR